MGFFIFIFFLVELNAREIGKKRKKDNQWLSWKKRKEKKSHLGEKKKLYVHLGGFQKF